MKIGLIDVDSHNFPNIPLMKISAWHKAKGDTVEWYSPLLSGHMDKVYVSKIFSFTPDVDYPIDADEIEFGGSGYCIELENGKEVYRKEKDKNLPYEIEHIYPDYSIYPELTKNRAYGRLTLGCPRQCSFCHTGVKDGICSHKVADVTEFWKDQKEICLIDQNILACREWKELLLQLKETNAYIDFNGGLDIRMMTDEKAILLNQLKVKEWHFAWDRYEDKPYIIPKLELFSKYNKLRPRSTMCYVLVNYNTTLEQDLERIYTLRDLGYWAYVMVYNKNNLPKGHVMHKLQRWVNNRIVFGKCLRFEDYTRKQLEAEDIKLML